MKFSKREVSYCSTFYSFISGRCNFAKTSFGYQGNVIVFCCVSLTINLFVRQTARQIMRLVFFPAFSIWRFNLKTHTIQYNEIKCHAMQCNAMQYSVMQYNAMQCNTIQCNAIQYNVMQYNTMQCNAIQYIAMQYNTNNTLYKHVNV